MKTHKLYLLFAFVGLTFTYIHAQPNYPPGDFYNDIAAFETHFDTLLLQGVTREELEVEGGEYSRYQQWRQFWEARLDLAGGYEGYYEALRDYHDNRGSFVSTPWDEIGPNQSPACGGIGPTFNLEFYELNTDRMLTISHHGGIFMSTDGGDNWFNTGTDTEWERSACQDAAFYPTAPDRIFGLSGNFVGLVKIRGTKASYVGPIRYLGGVYRKMDDFASWERIANFATFANDSISIAKILFDRKVNSSFDHTMFLATNYGMWKSENPSANGLPNFTQITIPTPASVINAHPGFNFDPTLTTVYDIEYQPDVGGVKSSTMYASVAFYGTLGSVKEVEWRVMQSDNDGLFWYEVAGQQAGYDRDLRYITIEVSKADPDKIWCLFQIVYPCQDEYTIGDETCNHDGDNNTPDITVPLVGHVSKFSLNTQVWAILPYLVNETWGSGHGFGLSQTDANSLGLVYGQTGSACNSSGATMRIIDLPTGSQITNTTPHVDIRDIVFHPDNPDEVWVCNDGGVAVSSDNGLSWTDKSDGLGVSQVNYIATSHTSPDYVLVSQHHDGTVLTRTPYPPTGAWNPNWGFMKTGDGTRCLIFKEDPDHMWASSNSSWVKFINATTSNTQSNPTNPPTQFWREGDLNKVHQGIIYRSASFNGQENIARSMDNGGSDEIISDFSVYFPGVFQNGVGGFGIEFIKSNPYAPDHLYVVERVSNWQYRIFRTVLANHPDPLVVKNDWELLPVPRIDTRAKFTGLTFDAENPNIVYFSYSSHDANQNNALIGTKMVYKMDYTDPTVYDANGFTCGGNNPCQDLTMNLWNTFSSEDALMSEKGTDGNLYFATDFGLYYTNNARIAAFSAANFEDADDPSNQSGWVLIGDNLPHVLPRGVEITYGINKIRIGLKGRGVWEHSLYCPIEQFFDETGLYLNDEFKEAELYITSDAEIDAGTDVKYRAGNYVELKPGFSAKAGSNFYGYIHGCSSSGTSFRTHFTGDGNNENPTPKEQIDDFVDILIYPNPNDGQFTIRFPSSSIKSQEADVTVYNLIGKQLRIEQRVVQGAIELDISNQPAGVYLVQVKIEDQLFTKKIIKE